MKKLLFLLLFLSTFASAQNFWVTGYWEYWSASFPDPKIAGSIDWNTITHIIHHQGNPSQTQIVDAAIPQVHYWSPGSGTFASYEVNQRSLIDSAHAHGRKVLLGLGGTGGTGINWDWMSANGKMKEFVSGISYYCKLRGYDGIDLDWEYPGGGSSSGVTEVSAAYDLLRTMRDTLNTWQVHGLITWACQPWTGNWFLSPDSLRKWVDKLNAMNYDYNDYGSSTNKHHTALRAPAGSADSVNTTAYQDSLYTTNSPKNSWGATSHYNKTEIAVGLGFYGHGRTGNALNGAGTSAGFERYGNCTLGMYQGANAYRYHYDSVAQSPYLAWTDATLPSCGFATTVHFHTFDDTTSIAFKSKWAKDNGYGGLMIFDLPGDDNNYSLQKAVKKGLTGTAPPPVTYSIAVTQTINGVIAPGTTSVTQGTSQLFSITANVNYQVNSIVVDGVSLPASTSYAFTNVMSAHSLSATYTVLPVYCDSAGIAIKAYAKGVASIDTMAIIKRTLASIPDSLPPPWTKVPKH